MAEVSKEVSPTDAQFLCALAAAQGFPRKLPAGWVFVCGAGVLEGSAPQNAVLAVKNYQLNAQKAQCAFWLFL